MRIGLDRFLRALEPISQIRTEPGAGVRAEREARKRSHSRATASFRNEAIGPKARDPATGGFVRWVLVFCSESAITR